MTEKELKKIISMLEQQDKKISNIEKLLRNTKKSDPSQEKKKSSSQDYRGLKGGIQFLINKKFLDSPKELNEIISKLKEEGYHYGKAPIAKALSVDFTNKKKILTRFKEGKNYKYVIRK